MNYPALIRISKDVERRPCPRNTHTHTLFSSSFHGRLSPQISFCDPHPTVFSVFLSSFGYKPASRRKQLSSRAASYTYPQTFSGDINNNNNNNNNTLLFIKRTLQNCPNALYIHQLKKKFKTYYTYVHSKSLKPVIHI